MFLLNRFYDLMHAHYGPTGWWPADSPFEIAVGAILTQNAAWTNVEKAIANLKRDNLLGPRKIAAAMPDRLERALRPSGYFRVKAKRLRHFCEHLNTHYRGSMKRLRDRPVRELREELLAVHGLGPETVDDILLYACEHPVFVVDAYTHRIFSRHGLVDPDVGYERLRAFFETRLPRDVALFKEYHGLIVGVGKDYCRPRPDCTGCPLASTLRGGQPAL